MLLFSFIIIVLLINTLLFSYILQWYKYWIDEHFNHNYITHYDHIKIFNIVMLINVVLLINLYCFIN